MKLKVHNDVFIGEEGYIVVSNSLFDDDNKEKREKALGQKDKVTLFPYLIDNLIKFHLYFRVFHNHLRKLREFKPEINEQNTNFCSTVIGKDFLVTVSPIIHIITVPCFFMFLLRNSTLIQKLQC